MSRARLRGEHPEALHLARLAKATPDQALDLPQSAGTLLTLHLTRPHAGESRACWYVCLGGEILIDLPLNKFVRLRTGETFRVGADTPRTLTPIGEGTLLIVQAEE